MDKAVLTLGLGLTAVRRIPTDADFALDPVALENAVAQDRAMGILPIAVVATVGTTSTTAIDPVPAIADICERERLWLHVDAAYGGAAALLPDLRWVLDGCDRADSIVVNPHKWLFVPIDCSVLFTRRPDVLRRAFSVVPEYLTDGRPDAGATDDPGNRRAEPRNLMDFGVALGRRFRALKLWFVLRHFGADGIRRRLASHIQMAHAFANWVDAEPSFERVAPAPLSVVVFRYRPGGEFSDDALDHMNSEILQRINASDEVFLSHTRVGGRYAIRLAIGNIRTELRHVERAWQLARDAARSVRRQL